MINYESGIFGFNTLLRIHGSALYKSIVPAIVSSIVYILLFEFTDLEEEGEEIFSHPYPVGALVAAFTFLLAFRANFAYNRYWEALTAVHLMHSKWLDFATEVAAFHYQSERYNAFKPPAFGAYPHVQNVHRERERLEAPTKSELEQTIENMQSEQKITGESQKHVSMRTRFRLFRKNRMKNGSKKDANAEEESKKVDKEVDAPSIPPRRTQSVEFVRNHLSMGTRQHKSMDDVTMEGHEKAIKSINRKPTAHKKGTKNQRRYDLTLFDDEGKPFSTFVVAARKHLQDGGFPQGQSSLFLEEAAHLLSLLSAVAMSTLRNDLEEAESPLIDFTPGAPWPHVDPDAYAADIRKGWSRHGDPGWTILRYLLGISRTDTSRTIYNYHRPFRVINGVSDSEIDMLQAARGPFAKVALCTLWLQEFISREHMSGSTGKVAPPIISRLYQFTSDGMSAYNQARKIAYTPFPLPHAQITTLFVLVIIAFIPILMLTYLTNEVFGFMLNGLTVMCFSGLHEVARELEAPFQNVPNDIPLNNFQAQFNEGIMVMFYGYHPDLYWQAEDEQAQASDDKDKEATTMVDKEKETATTMMDKEKETTPPKKHVRKSTMTREEIPLVEESPATYNKEKLDENVAELLPKLDSSD